MKSNEVWWKSNNHSKLLAHGTNTNFDAKNYMQSHRSKLCTLLSVVLFVYANRYRLSFPLQIETPTKVFKKE